MSTSRGTTGDWGGSTLTTEGSISHVVSYSPSSSTHLPPTPLIIFALLTVLSLTCVPHHPLLLTLLSPPAALPPTNAPFIRLPAPFGITSLLPSGWLPQLAHSSARFSSTFAVELHCLHLPPATSHCQRKFIYTSRLYLLDCNLFLYLFSAYFLSLFFFSPFL